jgi:O-methyltransferase domain
MSETAIAPQPAPPEGRLIELLMGQVVSRLIHLAAVLNLPDHLATGPKTAEELAKVTATDPPTLYRVMRTLASLGLFTEDGARRFSLLPFGETLRTGSSGRAAALIIGGDSILHSIEHALYSVQTGKTGFEKAMGLPLFDWLSKHPKEASLFGETMVEFHGQEPPAVAAAYDFSGFQTIADVGGATGNMLAAILSRYPKTRGILFDLPHAAAQARAILGQSSLADRIRIESGSFFEGVPAGADAYILSHVIHDWNEDQCLTILGNVRRAMNPAGKVLIVEMVLPPGDTPHFGKLLDMMMLFVPGGRERTEAEYNDLLDKAGFRLTRVVPTASLVSVVEAVPR